VKLELTNEFTVAAPRSTLWALLTDIRRVARCMPGAQVDAIDGDAFQGSMKVKIGPIIGSYLGSGRIVERDERAGRMAVEVASKEARGQGTAKGRVTASLAVEGGVTRVVVEMEGELTGRPAQFGRGVLQDVAKGIVEQFAACLQQEAGGAASLLSPPVGQVDRRAVGAAPDTPALDLVAVSRKAVARRALAAAVAAAVAALVYVILRRRRR
jgi:carbon monoxide dehydrogenase subunit G